MENSNRLHPEDIATIIEGTARRVVELQGLAQQTAPRDPWLTREQAEKHLNVSRTVFYRLRKKHPEALAPASEHPPRWSRDALDMFKITGGRPIVRPGRRARA